MKHSERLFGSSLLLSLVLMATAATAAPSAESAAPIAEPSIIIEEPDYSDWYQFEVIVFSLVTPQPSDEAWPPRELAYPPEMVRIDDGDVKPMLLAQLANLEPNVEDEDGTAPATDIPNDFLFSDRSRTVDPMRERLERTQTDTGGEPVEEAPQIDIAALFQQLRQTDTAPFATVPAAERFLNGAARSITLSSNYRLMDHLAWRQPVKPGETWHILVQSGDQYGDRFVVDGTLAFTRSRYLHADANLWYTRFIEDDSTPAPAAELPPGVSREFADAFPELLEAARQESRFLPVHTHKLNASQRLERGVLHYLDHPWFGVLVQVERYEGPEESSP